MRANSVAERFWSHVRRTEDCWIWTGATRSGGYGVFRDGTRSVSAHRFAWEMEYGPIPTAAGSDGSSVPWLISHTCGSRRCVRPDHLRLLPPMVSGEAQSEPEPVLVAAPSGAAAAGVPPPIAGAAAFARESPLLRRLCAWQESLEYGVRLSERLASSIMAVRAELQTLRGQPGLSIHDSRDLPLVGDTGWGLSRPAVRNDAEAGAAAQMQAAH